MRLRIVLEAARETALPINYQEYLTASVYHLLGTSSADFARFLHDDGYHAIGSAKRFKLFHFGWLRGRRRVAGPTLRFAPGSIEWHIGSPPPDFLTHCATGLLAAGSLQVGPATFGISAIETLPPPKFTGTPAGFSCLSPIVCALPLPDGRTRYLRPAEGEEFSEAVRRNLLAKHQALYGALPDDDTLHLHFGPAYLERSPGTKKITYKGIDIVGAFAPFTLSGSPALIQLGYDVGLGEKNAAGFGMVEAAS